MKVYPPFFDPFRKQQRQAHFKPRYAIGNVFKVRIFSMRQFAGRVESIWGVIGGDDLEGAILETAPDDFLRCLVAGRRAAAEHGAVHARSVEIASG